MKIEDIDKIIVSVFHIRSDELWYDDIKIEMMIAYYKNINRNDKYKLTCMCNKGYDFLKMVNKGINGKIINNDEIDRMFNG